MLAVGCSDTIALGSECPSFASECERDLGGADASDAGAATAPGQDAQVAGDPAPGADDASTSAPEPPAPLPQDATSILNGSFEVTSLADPFGTLEIADWAWCQGDVEVSSSFDGHDASDGNALLSLSFGIGFPVLSQQLTAPMRAGLSYTVAIDAARSGEGPDELRVLLFGGSEACAQTELLAESAPLSSDGQLATYCLTLTPSTDYAHLALAVDPLVFTGAVYVDNLRVDPGCTP